MAGDWIKIRQDIHDDPSVVGMAARLSLSEDEVVGGLVRLWIWADKHTTDGKAPSITPVWVDRYVSRKGFAEAMVEVGWLRFSERGVVFPHFDRHNGDSAKTRASNTIRQRLSRRERGEGKTGEERTAIPKGFVKHVLERDGGTCVYCGDKGGWKKGTEMGIDHLTPCSRGGSSAIENLVTCCQKCNNEKNDRTPHEWGIFPTFLSDKLEYIGGLVVTKMSQDLRDNTVTREEKRREEKFNTPPTPPAKRGGDRRIFQTGIGGSNRQGKSPAPNAVRKRRRRFGKRHSGGLTRRPHKTRQSETEYTHERESRTNRQNVGGVLAEV